MIETAGIRPDVAVVPDVEDGSGSRAVWRARAGILRIL